MKSIAIVTNQVKDAEKRISHLAERLAHEKKGSAHTSGRLLEAQKEIDRLKVIVYPSSCEL